AGREQGELRTARDPPDRGGAREEPRGCEDGDRGVVRQRASHVKGGVGDQGAAPHDGQGRGARASQAAGGGGRSEEWPRCAAGRPRGTIIWESKHTKAWSDGWIQKLKDDKLAAKAQLAVLVSSAMPKDVPTFECRENVWVTPPIYSVALTAALRMMLIETAA